MSRVHAMPDGWGILSSRREQYGTRVLVVDDVALAGSDGMRFAYFEMQPSVVVVAMTAKRQVVLIRQYRHPVRTWCWELPAGVSLPGEALETAAARELREETGVLCDRLVRVGEFFPAPHATSERLAVLRGDVVQMGESQTEPGEAIEVGFVDVETARSMALRGDIMDGPSAFALLLALESWEGRS